jgi:hypothetical protein
VVTPGERVPALVRNRILFEDGVPVASRVRSAGDALGSYGVIRYPLSEPGIAIIQRGSYVPVQASQAGRMGARGCSSLVFSCNPPVCSRPSKGSSQGWFAVVEVYRSAGELPIE